MSAENHLEMVYRGYVVAYSDNQDVWRCWALDVEGERLPTVKAKIDRIIAAARKLDNPVPAMQLTYQDELVPVRIMSLAQPRKDRSGAEKEPDAAWCMCPKSEWYWDREQGKRLTRMTEGREKLSLDRLYEDTPENRDRLAEATRLKAEIKRLTARRDEVIASMSKVATAIFKIADPAEPDEADPE